jgi:hypothetical protein
MLGTPGLFWCLILFVNLLRFFGKATLAVFISLCALFCLILTVSQVTQHVFRLRAERLLAEVQSLELRKTPWPETQRLFQHWGSAAKLNGDCDRQGCSVDIALAEPVYAFVIRTRIYDAFGEGPFERGWEEMARAYVRLGGRPARAQASVGIRDGVVWSKGFAVQLETFAHNVPGTWEGEYTLLASMNSRPRLGPGSGFQGVPNRQLTLHPDYEIGSPSGCDFCVDGWVNFTPYAEPADIRRLMQLDLSCLTRIIHPCRTQRDIMPNAWTQYLAEGPPADANPR